MNRKQLVSKLIKSSLVATTFCNNFVSARLCQSFTWLSVFFLHSFYNIASVLRFPFWVILVFTHFLTDLMLFSFMSMTQTGPSFSCWTLDLPIMSFVHSQMLHPLPRSLSLHQPTCWWVWSFVCVCIDSLSILLLKHGALRYGETSLLCSQLSKVTMFQTYWGLFCPHAFFRVSSQLFCDKLHLN